MGVLISLLFLVAHFTGFSPLRTLEYQAYDVGVAASQHPADNRIVILAIDDDSIDRIGRWPWPRTTIADMITKVAQAGARLIGVDIFYSETLEKPRGLNAQLQLAELLKQQGKDAEAAKVLADARAMDEDKVLADAVTKSGNTLMPIFFELGTPRGKPDQQLPDYIARDAIPQVSDPAGILAPLTAVKMRYPYDDLAEAAAGLGHLNVAVDSDGSVRTEPLAINYYGRYFPSMSLLMAAKDLNLSMQDIRINSETGIELGALTIGTDPQLRMRPAFHTDKKTGKDFTTYSFYDVQAGRIPASLLKDKIVLIGITANGIGDTLVTPVNTRMSGVEFNANTLQSILKEDFFTHPTWAMMVELGLLLLVALYLILLLPRLGAGMGALISGLLFVTLIAADVLLLTGSALWIQTMTAAALLLTGHILLTTKRYFATEEDRQKISADSAETNKMLGLSFQSQGMLDMAFDKFRKCPVNDDILSILYNLALDFERKRQFNKAMAVYEYMSETNPNYKDIAARLERVKNAGETLIFGSSTTGGGMSTLLITGGAKPTLGRYEIVKELGKGAMGTVYLGRDPKINREVAIKTMALSQEFEADELEEVKERFFREAETAGMLNHPNIVTIFDAGEEHDLAYIAMEFLNGSDLSPFTKPGKLLSKVAVLKIIGKVAEALNYAHGKGVIHRDIKPANIMLLKNKTIKVTDFGIARITASSKTKTGVVLGTPSYMSPEQLSGKHVDGRSDLFSLGVMMYEMLTGTRPFRGDSMATLMFQIANEPHPDIREHCPELPESLSRLIDKLLSKDPNTRIGTGNELVKGIIQCLNDMHAQGGS
ncbi:MAG TPA: serine/threonine-protein kinase [Mariprofundaceae bacterium]|nr:serine/threonine-protein kinase [Mariprofundaceae bacterium]